ETCPLARVLALGEQDLYRTHLIERDFHPDFARMRRQSNDSHVIPTSECRNRNLFAVMGPTLEDLPGLVGGPFEGERRAFGPSLLEGGVARHGAGVGGCGIVQSALDGVEHG